MSLLRASPTSVLDNGLKIVVPEIAQISGTPFDLLDEAFR